MNYNYENGAAFQINTNLSTIYLTTVQSKYT